jgi:hypothetical protein
MMGQLGLKFKSQRYLLPLFLVVVLLQVVLGQASSYVLSDRQPPLSLAVQQLGSDETSDELVAQLKETGALKIIEIDSASSTDEALGRERVQGLLVIPEEFGELLNNGRRSPVVFYPAPGITNQDFATEQIAGAIVQLKARHALNVALQEIGAEQYGGNSVETSDLLDVVYEGPLLQGTTQDTTVVYGVSALLILLAYLHAALTVPTREDKQLLVHGRRAFVRQLLLSLLVVWIVWAVVIALFFAITALLSGVAPNMSVFSGFVVIMLYTSLLAALIAQFTGRHVASWVFLPLLLLNMTLGGGLWAKIVVSPLLAPLVPVTAVAGTGDAALLGMMVLVSASAALALGLLLSVIYRTNDTLFKQHLGAPIK